MIEQTYVGFVTATSRPPNVGRHGIEKDRQVRRPLDLSSNSVFASIPGATALPIASASPLHTQHMIVPLVLPGIASGALLAFVTSFDEVVVVLFLADYNQRTIPIQMWNGVREQLSPVILAAATLLS